jgi:uncharacterized membrane protein YGL010W
MEKNIKLLYCILGSTMLVLLETPVFGAARLAILQDRSYASSSFGLALYTICNIISFIGFILVIIFSVILIIRNINFKNK